MQAMDAAKLLAQAIQESPEYREYIQLKKEIDEVLKQLNYQPPQEMPENESEPEDRQAGGSDDQQQEREILTRSYALAINTGMKEIFYSEDISAETLQSILQIYLHSFIIMLDSDLAQRNDGYSFYHIPTPEQ